jgi:hypothetical protein
LFSPKTPLKTPLKTQKNTGTKQGLKGGRGVHGAPGARTENEEGGQSLGTGGGGVVLEACRNVFGTELLSVALGNDWILRGCVGLLSARVNAGGGARACARRLGHGR